MKKGLNMKENSKTSNIIADIQVNIQDRFSHEAEVLMEYNSCVLCGTELEFTHVTHFIKNEVQETAYCPLCDIQNRQETHKLQ